MSMCRVFSCVVGRGCPHCRQMLLPSEPPGTNLLLQRLLLPVASFFSTDKKTKTKQKKKLHSSKAVPLIFKDCYLRPSSLFFSRTALFPQTSRLRFLIEIQTFSWICPSCFILVLMYIAQRSSQVAPVVKNMLANEGDGRDRGLIPAPYSSILAWRIP